MQLIMWLCIQMLIVHRDVSDVLALNFKNASASTVTFTGLEKGQTYYVGECESDGTCYLANICADGTMYMVNFSDGNAVTVDNADGSTTVYFDNQFEKIPDGYYKEAELNITKKLVGSDGKAKNSNEIFYAGIFADEASHSFQQMFLRILYR